MTISIQTGHKSKLISSGMESPTKKIDMNTEIHPNEEIYDLPQPTITTSASTLKDNISNESPFDKSDLDYKPRGRLVLFWYKSVCPYS